MVSCADNYSLISGDTVLTCVTGTEWIVPERPTCGQGYSSYFMFYIHTLKIFTVNFGARLVRWSNKSLEFSYQFFRLFDVTCPIPLYSICNLKDLESTHVLRVL